MTGVAQLLVMVKLGDGPGEIRDEDAAKAFVRNVLFQRMPGCEPVVIKAKIVTQNTTEGNATA